jgi:hypothetical protein
MGDPARGVALVLELDLRGQEGTAVELGRARLSFLKARADGSSIAGST